MVRGVVQLFCVIAVLAVVARDGFASRDPGSCDALLVAVDANKIILSLPRFRSLFHDILAQETVTGLREELKTVVTTADVEAFLAGMTEIMGSDRISLRDVPADPSEAFVTNTDYLLPLRAYLPNEHVAHKAVIRVRNYFVVDGATSVAQIDEADARGELDRLVRYSRLADQDGNLAKLEFKVGHPSGKPDDEPNAEAAGDEDYSRVDIPGVVDKPGIVLSKADVNALFGSQEVFEDAHDRVLRDAMELKRTQKGVARPVNDLTETQKILEAVGTLHRELGGGLAPAFNIRYKRVARKIMFDHPTLRKADGTPAQFEVQVTVDREIRFRDLRSGQEFHYAEDERVLELKTPLEFARKSDEELEAMGLGQLAAVRRLYRQIPSAPGTEPGKGKRARGRRELQKRGTLPVVSTRARAIQRELA